MASGRTGRKSAQSTQILMGKVNLIYLLVDDWKVAGRAEYKEE